MAMAITKVPVVPQWNLSNGCVATPDGGLLYIGARTINYISRVVDDSSPIIKVFHTRQAILSLAIDPEWPLPADDKIDAASTMDKRNFAVLAQDNSVQIWDFDRGCAVYGHKAHFTTMTVEGNGPPSFDKVLLSYMSNRNVLSIGSSDIVIYCVASNSFCRKRTFIPSRNQHLTVLRCSPYNENTFAVGTSRGLVLVCDLQQMNILYTLRGHDAQITALSWTLIDNESLIKCNKKITTKAPSPIKSTVYNNRNAAKMVAQGGDDIFDIYDYDYLEHEFGAPSNVEKSKPYTEAANAEFIGIEKSVETETTKKFDFVEACQSLKEEITAMKEQKSDEDEAKNLHKNDEVTLTDCQAMMAQNADLSSSCGDEDNDESTEGSMELVERSSDDDMDVDGVVPKITKSLSGCLVATEKLQILHKAEVHSEQNDIVESSEEKENSENIEEVSSNKQEPLTSVNKSYINKDILLVSASTDGTLWVWNAETGAGCDQLRPRGSHHGQHGKNSHIEVHWLNATTFLTTNRTGEISWWTMLPQEDNVRRYKFKEEKQKQTVQRGIVSFSICQGSNIIWTISSHREVTCEDIVEKKLIAKYCCASTNISAMRECPDDMNKIALGFADRRIGIIDISKLSSTNVTIENYSQKIDAPVLSIVWSPDNRKIAFGTTEGRVGVFNVENLKSQPFIFTPHCGKPIYSIAWHAEMNAIFACCNEKLAVYDGNMNNKDAYVIDVSSISAVSVQNEFLFVGTQRGHLKIYQQTSSFPNLLYALIDDIEIGPRYITEIAWSPIICDQFAVASMANRVNILKFDKAAGNATHIRKFEIKNAKAANACVKWSNRNGNLFLTCGFDGAIRIWDLDSTNDDSEIFLKQFHCPMLCGLFLPTDENIIMCAGKSTSVEFFNMTTEKSEGYSLSKWNRSNTNTLENVQWALKMNARVDADKPTAAEKRRKRHGGGKAANKESASNCNDVNANAVPTVEIAANNSISELPTSNGKTEEILGMLDNLNITTAAPNELEIQNIEKIYHSETVVLHKNEQKCAEGSVFMRNPTTLLFLTSKEINKDPLDKLIFTLSHKNNKNFIKAGITAKLFSRKQDAKDLLDDELLAHQHSDTKGGIASLLMPQCKGNMKDEIVKCIQNKQLTEWHISLAPTISYNFWQNCCQAFAEQLMEQGYALQAATYMTAIHKQPEAIQMLLDRNYFKEAMLIGRVYLQPDEPLLDIITDRWISYLDFTGNLAGAAYLCVLSGQINRAYEILCKIRNTKPEIEHALKLLKTHDKFH